MKRENYIMIMKRIKREIALGEYGLAYNLIFNHIGRMNGDIEEVLLTEFMTIDTAGDLTTNREEGWENPVEVYHRMKNITDFTRDVFRVRDYGNLWDITKEDMEYLIKVIEENIDLE